PCLNFVGPPHSQKSVIITDRSSIWGASGSKTGSYVGPRIVEEQRQSKWHLERRRVDMAQHDRFHYKSLDELKEDITKRGLNIPVSADLAVLLRPINIGNKVVPNRLAI